MSKIKVIKWQLIVIGACSTCLGFVCFRMINNPYLSGETTGWGIASIVINCIAILGNLYVARIRWQSIKASS